MVIVLAIYLQCAESDRIIRCRVSIGDGAVFGDSISVIVPVARGENEQNRN